ncbi:hypothetical protein [Lentzea aerocolonigenes]|uniref:hypothetical protein n=1 Tax=Lentzea aerocolonigenes TaxID=68170 RepID=UPI0004C3175A|nr:hypothetical protein [Lentzea aerocolonigenes]MCP2250637.1 hypothetical protein [Lentzea aerocolonigenes]
MTPDHRLTPFRDEALAQDIPAADVDRWLALARPCATLTRGGDGPVVGEFGGPLLLPADAPDPEHPYVGWVDLAALPPGVTDLPLPGDGRLLFFAFPQVDDDSMGSVVHVPAGAAVEERDKLAWDEGGWDEYEELVEAFPQGPLRLKADVSLPCHGSLPLPDGRPLPGHPRSEDLASLWEDAREDIAPLGELQIGGYADEEAIESDPVVRAVSDAVRAGTANGWEVSSDAADWVLLADWQVDVDDYEGATVHWVMQRSDLAAGRFERAFVSVFHNP